VRRDSEQDLALAQGFSDQPQVAFLQVAEAAVDQAAGTRTGAEAEVVLVHKERLQAAHGRVAGDAGARDASTDDEQVGRSGSESFC
jgi:hypothetical protein